MVKMAIINAENLILGRLASVAAKRALLGEEINIINCEKAIITGNKKDILDNYLAKYKKGEVFRGPFFPKNPDKIVRRTIRGMLPYKKEKGRKAFERIKCFIGVPEEFKEKQAETVENANISKLPSLRYMVLGEVCRLIGAKWQK